jgi:hypothetical protein
MVGIAGTHDSGSHFVEHAAVVLILLHLSLCVSLAAQVWRLGPLPGTAGCTQGRGRQARHIPAGVQGVVVLCCGV